jgi:hypothetical protein
MEGGIAVAPAAFGHYGGDLIAPNETSGRVYAIRPDGTVVTLAVSGLPHGGDIGVESAGFLPPGFGAGDAAYLADRYSKGNKHPGTNSILRLPGSQPLKAGARPGDLLIATEARAHTIVDRRLRRPAGRRTDLRWRRSVLVRMTEDGWKLEDRQDHRQPGRAACRAAGAGENPRVVLEATYGRSWTASGSGPDTHRISPCGPEMTCRVHAVAAVLAGVERPAGGHPVDRDQGARRAPRTRARRPCAPPPARALAANPPVGRGLLPYPGRSAAIVCQWAGSSRVTCCQSAPEPGCPCRNTRA